MAPKEVQESFLAAVALGTTILLLGALFLLILRTPRFQFSLRFLVALIGCVALMLGSWTAVLRTIDSSPAAAPRPKPDAKQKAPGRNVDPFEFIDEQQRDNPNDLEPAATSGGAATDDAVPLSPQGIHSLPTP